MQTWRVGIDCRLSGTENTGIGRYIVRLVPAIINQAPKHYTWVLFVFNQKQQHQLTSAIKPQKQKRLEIKLTPIKHYSLKEQIQLVASFNQANLDLLHVPHFNRPILYSGKTVITIHDLLWHQHKGGQVTTLPWWLYHVKYQFYKYVVGQAVNVSQKIIVPSQKTKKDLVDYYPKARHKTVVIYEGTDLASKSHKPKKIIPEEFILYVGSLYPHKNIRLVLQALAKDRSLKLVIVSARSVFRDRVAKIIQALKLTHQVIFFDWVNDAQLKYLYQKAKALVQPSLNEGFGLTGVEALQQNTPVIASDIEVFHEVYGPFAHYFNPKDVDALLKWLQQPKTKLQQKLKSKPLAAWLARYQWQAAAQATLAVYETVITGHKT